MTLTRIDAQALTSLVLRDSPEFFVSDVLGSGIYDKQREMARSLAANRRTAVVGCNSCIAPETRILNADTGEERRVDGITGEWPVWSISEGQTVRAVARRPFIEGTADLYRVTLTDGSTFIATLGHRILTPAGWRQLGELSPNVPVRTGSLLWSAIQSITFLRRGVYYDLHVPGANNYLAQGTFHHNSGKDYMTARLVMWWMETHSPAKALVYGPTHRQVQDIVFSEMRTAYDSRPRIDGLPLRGHMFETARYTISRDSYAIGFATKTTTGSTEVFNLQGFHSPNLLVVITEAHAITQAEYNTVLRLHPARVIMTGNAFVQSGPFYDAFHDKSEGWYQIHIEASDTPNLQGGDIPGLVTQEDIDEALREWGIDSPLYQGSVLARFPDNLEEMLCPLHDVNAAANRTAVTDAPGELRIAGLDVAGPGTDKTVLLFRQGPLTRYLYRGHEPDTMTTARRALDISIRERVQYLVVDDAGIGGRVVERMRLILKEEPLYKSIRVIAFNGGARPRDPKRFYNANAEIYWRTRLWLNEQDSSIENDRILIGQLTARKYELNPKGQIVVESKRDMRKRGLSKSPDEADALAMTFAIRQRASMGSLGESKESAWV